MKRQRHERRFRIPYYGSMSRRLGWLTHYASFARLNNLALAALEYTFHRKKLRSSPAILKIDISPLCNLRCTVCVHANPGHNPNLHKQHFSAGQRMTVDQYRHIIEQIRDKTLTVSLYYLGDPLMHPDLPEICRITARSRLNSHVSTNFSLRLGDERIEELVTSGLTHLTVCVDGMTQETYQRTRVGGRLPLVLSNLQRTCAIKRRLGRKYPQVEVQFIKFRHNQHEVEEGEKWCRETGVDQFTTYWGSLHNYTDFDPRTLRVFESRRSLLPGCWWPYLSVLIKYNGDVIPCCVHRLGEQYTREGTHRILGNVFQTRLEEIWNSKAYQDLRRLVCNPKLAETDPSLKDHFCYGCKRLYRTDAKSLSARDHTYESIYELNERGVPVRRHAIACGQPQPPLTTIKLPTATEGDDRAPIADCA